MPVNPLDRPIDVLREETIDQLTLNYSHGELSLEAFERRLDKALEAETNEVLLSLTEDLDLVVDSVFEEQKRREFGFMTDSRDVMDEDRIISIFGGSKRKGVWDVSKEIRISNIFGGTDLDFGEARFTSQVTRINISCVFGGVNIFVPEGVNIVTKAACILGNVNNRAPSSNAPDSPTIVLEGFVLFGGVNIKLKKTFRERLLQFAETVKNMFDLPTK